MRGLVSGSVGPNKILPEFSIIIGYSPSPVVMLIQTERTLSDTHRNHSTAKSRDTACTGMLREDRTMMRVTMLELGTEGRARLAIAVSKL